MNDNDFLLTAATPLVNASLQRGLLPSRIGRIQVHVHEGKPVLIKGERVWARRATKQPE